MEGTRFAKFDYYIDESDPDIVLLRRQDGAFAAAFSARGVTPGLLRWPSHLAYSRQLT